MTARLSTGLVNALMFVGSFADSFANCALDIYSGPQPTLPDNAATGTLLVTLTNNGGAYTPETRPVGSITLLTGAAGSVNTLTINGVDILGVAVPFDTSLTQTAADMVVVINSNPENRLFVASSVGAVVTLTGVAGLGDYLNTWAVAATLTTLTASYVAMAGGVDAVNGLRCGAPTVGVLPKLASQVWSGVAVAAGTAGWFRLRENIDTGVGATTTGVRYDGAIGTSGAEMNLGSLSIALSAPFSITGAAFTLPQQ